MTSDAPLLDLALSKRLITRKQHEAILAELAAQPEQRVQELLLARHYLTPAQVERLLAQVQEQETLRTAEMESADARALQKGGVDSLEMQDILPGLKYSIRTEKLKAEASKVVQEGPKHFVPEQVRGSLKQLLRLARHWGCSDLHVSTGRPPFVRIAGEARYLEMEALTAEAAYKLNFQMLTPEQRDQAHKDLTLDFALDIPGVGRHRCNVFKQRLGWDGAYRIVSDVIPTLADLGMPEIVRTLTEYQQGMVLVTGPAGSGKTTTLAAMVNHINANRFDHVLTIEDPIEFVHTPQSCQVTHREIGPHSESYNKALRAALREDPDVILMGELRDHETVSIAVSAAETGHLVLGTLHTGSAARTISRVLDVFPPNQQRQICIMISESLRGVISQRLLPRRDGKGRVLAYEILVVTRAAAQLIREVKLHQLVTIMQAGKRLGMVTLEESLMNLYQQGLITGSDAYRNAENKTPFEAMKNET